MESTNTNFEEKFKKYYKRERFYQIFFLLLYIFFGLPALILIGVILITENSFDIPAVKIAFFTSLLVFSSILIFFVAKKPFSKLPKKEKAKKFLPIFYKISGAIIVIWLISAILDLYFAATSEFQINDLWKPYLPTDIIAQVILAVILGGSPIALIILIYRYLNKNYKKSARVTFEAMEELKEEETAETGINY